MKTLKEAQEDMKEGMAKASSMNSVKWKQDALLAIYHLCVTQPEFFSDDIWNTGLAQPPSPRGLGPVLIYAKGLGWCERTDRTKSSVNSNMSQKPIWKSLIYP